MKEKLTFILPKGSKVTDMGELEYRIEGLIGYDSNSITYAATPFVMGKEINHRVVDKYAEKKVEIIVRKDNNC